MEPERARQEKGGGSHHAMAAIFYYKGLRGLARAGNPDMHPSARVIEGSLGTDILESTIL